MALRTPILAATISLEEPLLERDQEQVEPLLEAATGRGAQKSPANSESPWANVKFDTTLGCPMCIVADFGFKCVSATAASVKNLVIGIPANKV